ncbi:MAG: prolipoprotein diacylglyceryl transferase family protein, partial [Chloroflexota bacterium]
LPWGGLHVGGAIMGVAIVAIFLANRQKKSIWGTLYKAIVGLLVISSLTGWGHFLNQELYGYPTELFLGIQISPEYRLPRFLEYERFVPLFLFASIWNLLGATWFIFDSRWKTSDKLLLDGVMVGSLWFVVGRLFVELLIPDFQFNWLPASLILLLIVVLAFQQQFTKIH